MSCVVKLRIGGDVMLEVTADSPKALVSELSAYSEVLVHQTCGNCKGTSVRHEHRLAKGYEFYGMRCLDCGAKLDFGQHKEGGTLFAKTGEGWQVYRSESVPDDVGGF